MSDEPSEFSAVEIETARLLLRAPGRRDVDAIARLANDHGVASMTARMPFPYGTQDAEAFVEAQRACRRNGSELVLAIIDKDDNGLLGCVGLDFCHSGAVAEIGYWVGRPFWGMGYATEAARALIDHAFETTLIEAVSGACRVINDASRRVMEKCGLRYTMSGLDPAPARGGAFPVDRFRLSRRDWESFKAWRPAIVRDLPDGLLDAMCG